MLNTTLQIYNESEYTYPIRGGFIPTIHTYLHDEGIRDAVLVVPGGGYRACSPTEAEVVALKFYNAGFNVFVVTYTVNFLHKQPLGKQCVKDISRAVRVIRAHEAEFRITDSVSLVGFSAGAHIITMLAEDYAKDYLADEVFEASNKPSKLVLCYPLLDITMYKDFFIGPNLMGNNATDEMVDEYNTIKNLTKDMPPIYMWHTEEDQAVPCTQSQAFKAKCDELGISCEYHLFEHGKHGLSTADEDWALGNYGEFYTAEQIITEVCDAFIKGEKEILPEPFNTMNSLDEVGDLFKKWEWGDKKYGLERVNEEVASWFFEAVLFLMRK